MVGIVVKELVLDISRNCLFVDDAVTLPCRPLSPLLVFVVLLVVDSRNALLLVVVVVLILPLLLLLRLLCDRQ